MLFGAIVIWCNCQFGVGWIPAWYSFRRVGVQAGGFPAAEAWMIAPLDLGKVGEAIPSYYKARNPYLSLLLMECPRPNRM